MTQKHKNKRTITHLAYEMKQVESNRAIDPAKQVRLAQGLSNLLYNLAIVYIQGLASLDIPRIQRE